MLTCYISMFLPIILLRLIESERANLWLNHILYF